MKQLLFAALGFCSLAPAAELVAEGPRTWHPGAEECTPETTRTEARSIGDLARSTDDRAYVIRQNPCVDHEANLVYLLPGTERALLIDTGAVEGAAAAPLVDWVQTSLKYAGKGKLGLLVVHTHDHQDHRAGDSAILALPNTEILRTPTGTIDLGERDVQVIPTPGHHPNHVVFYDARTQALFTGDFLLRGRLLVDDLDAYRQSAQRMSEFVAKHPVEHVLGAHIELDIFGNPFPGGATFHPNESLRPLTVLDVHALPAALENFNGFYSRYPNFIVVNPIHNLLALATGVIVGLGLPIWFARSLWKRRRVSGTQ